MADKDLETLEKFMKATISYAEKNRAIGLVKNVRQVKGRKRLNISLAEKLDCKTDYKKKFEELKCVIKESHGEVCVCVGCDAICGSLVDDGTWPWDTCYKCKQDICGKCSTKANPEPMDKKEYLSIYYCHLCKDEQSDTELE